MSFSTVSSSINALVAVTTEDFILPFCKNLTNKQVTWMNMGLSKLLKKNLETFKKDNVLVLVISHPITGFMLVMLSSWNCLALTLIKTNICRCLLRWCVYWDGRSCLCDGKCSAGKSVFSQLWPLTTAPPADTYRYCIYSDS